jgi:superfamily II DNA/RNA helicase
VAALRGRAGIVVARPGRLADLIGQGHCHLGDVGAVVLDEAGQMAGLGFVPVARRLLKATPPEGHRLLFPATLDGEVDVLARRPLARPAPAAGRGAIAASGGFRSRRRQGRRG